MDRTCWKTDALLARDSLKAMFHGAALACPLEACVLQSHLRRRNKGLVSGRAGRGVFQSGKTAKRAAHVFI
jgi:hypothetical protein